MYCTIYFWVTTAVVVLLLVAVVLLVGQKKMKAEAQRFQDLGGIESLVQTLTTFAYPQEMEKPHHFNIYMNVCAVLQNLVLLGMRQPILQSGAVRVLALIFESKANNKHHKKELEKTVKEVMKHLFEK